MDLKLLAAEPTDTERSAVDAVLGGPPEAAASRRFVSAGHALRERRHLLLPALHALNDRVGYVSHGGMSYISRRLDVPPAEAYGVATFYALLATEPRPPRIVHVCTDIACNARGAQQLCAGLEQRLGPARAPVANGKPDAVQWQRSPCLGMCEHAPVALAIEAGDPPAERMVTGAMVDSVVDVAKHGSDAGGGAPRPAAAIPQQGDPGLVLLRRIGVVDPASLDDYRASGGYESLRRAFDLGPAAVIEEVSTSKLSGRGGAAFPTGVKWQGAASQPALPHYLVCNADESEPGTFKDRIIMEGDPYAVVEAMTIAGYATGCGRGYLYIRGEYPSAARRLEHALQGARARNLLGSDIMGRGFDFDIEIRRGAGAYICGE
ncbi:MAG: NADH-quinone oxidoreductase subunit E, partial [Pseudonocardiales bacterium]